MVQFIFKLLLFLICHKLNKKYFIFYENKANIVYLISDDLCRRDGLSVLLGLLLLRLLLLLVLPVVAVFLLILLFLLFLSFIIIFLSFGREKRINVGLCRLRRKSYSCRRENGSDVRNTKLTSGF